MYNDTKSTNDKEKIAAAKENFEKLKAEERAQILEKKKEHQNLKNERQELRNERRAARAEKKASKK